MCSLFNPLKIREDFPILKKTFNGKPLIYLDNAATTQKPRQVIEAVKRFYEEFNANPHRGIYSLSLETTRVYEEARRKIARLINAGEDEVIFTRNTTDALNLAARMVLKKMGKGDAVVLTEMEHHSNLVPWQIISKERELEMSFIPFDENGYLDLHEAERLINDRVKAVALVHASNVLGTINPVEKIAAMAREVGAYTIVDAAQSVPHMPVDVKRLGVDFLAFSGHKMLGPMGVGVLYGRREVLEELEPVFGGGEAISEVRLRETRWRPPPWKFEPGTPNAAGVVGLAAAVDYLDSIGMENVRRHDIHLLRKAFKEMEEIRDVKIYGPLKPEDRAGLIAFNLSDIHPHDLASYLDQHGICIRAGHHCAMPLHERLGVPATARASFYIYNTEEEVDALAEALRNALEFFNA